MLNVLSFPLDDVLKIGKWHRYQLALIAHLLKRL
jgi:hypothetical protein